MANIEIPYIISLDARSGLKLEPQMKLLTQRLKNAGYSVESIRFPRVDETSSQFYQAYQNGQYGPPAEINPYLGALYATLDRLQASKDIQARSKQPDVLLLTNFVCSTLIDEASKITNPAVRQQYCRWLIQLEHFTYGIIYPDLSILLDESSEVPGQPSLIRQIVSFFPERCQAIGTRRESQNLTITSLNNAIWEVVVSRGPIRTKALLTPERTFRETDNEARVSAFTTEAYLSELIDAVTRLTQGKAAESDNESVTLSDASFSHQRAGEATGLGMIDNISGFHLFVGNISCLLAEKLKGHDCFSYYQSMDIRSAVSPVAGAKPNSYFIPPEFDIKTAKQYRLVMDKLIDNVLQINSKMSMKSPRNEADSYDREKKAPEEIVAPPNHPATTGLWPVAAFCRLSIFASFKQFQELIGKLRADDLPESRELAQKLASCITKTYPNLSLPKEAPKSESLSVKQLRNRHSSMKVISNIDVSANLPELPDTVTLLNYFPRSEFQVLPESLFEYSSLSNKKIAEMTDAWPYDKKVAVLRSFFNHSARPGMHANDVLRKISYHWELVSDFLSFQRLHHPMNAIASQYQALTPRYGYEIPLVLETAGLSEQYQEGFDLSYQLFSVLQKSGYDIEAQYATLLGHRLRWTMDTTALQMMRMYDQTSRTDQSLAPAGLISLMWEHLSEVHPILSECLMSISNRAK